MNDLKTTDQNSQGLTGYKAASLQELWSMAYPLILTATSTALMMFADRLILANYSITAFNAAVTASFIFMVFQLATLSIAGIAEVFVGQHNGAKRYNKIGEPVWQMIWFSLLSILIFAPSAYFLGPTLIAENYHEQGLPYFYWLMYMGPAFPFMIAMCAFYIGRGKTGLVLAATVLMNALNIILDILLIFGVDGIIPEMGTQGAAIATVFSQVFAGLLLFIVFLSKKYREQFGTNLWRLNSKVMKDCLKIGVPSSIGHIFGMGAWAVLFSLMARSSEEHTTVFAVGHSIMVLFFFFIEGLHKAIVALSSNLIGANKYDVVKGLIRSSMVLMLIFALITVTPFLVYPNYLVELFFMVQGQPTHLEGIGEMIQAAMFWLWLVIILDIILWSYAGVLIAAGDTVFVMVMHAINAWFFAVVPIYIYVFYFGGNAVGIWALSAAYMLICVISFYWRYRKGKWKTLSIISQ